MSGAIKHFEVSDWILVQQNNVCFLARHNRAYLVLHT